MVLLEQEELFGRAQSLAAGEWSWEATQDTGETIYRGAARTLSHWTAAVEAGLELLRATRYGLAWGSWTLTLRRPNRRPVTRTARLMAPTRRLPARVYLPNIGVFDADGIPLRQRKI